MDPWINSLVQSPLVRSLNTVPSRMSSFAHGVRDNVPPFSFVKEIIEPIGKTGWSTRPNDLVANDTTPTFTFRIPESGLLDRMYLRLRVLNRLPADPAATQAWVPFQSSINTRLQGANVHLQREDNRIKSSSGLSTPMNFASTLESVSLKTSSSKDIETLYPAVIAAEVQKMPHAQRMFWMQGMNGWAAGPNGLQSENNILTGASLVAPFSYLWDPFADVLEDKAAAADSVRQNAVNQNHYVDFLIPLPFSCLHQLKDNFQTRFVENMTLDVKLLADLGLFKGLDSAYTRGFSGYLCSLVAIYHNFHDVIENSIRDQNYKRGFPASVYSHFALTETARARSGKTIQVLLAQRNIISEIHCVVKRSSSQLATIPADVGGANPVSYFASTGFLQYSPPPPTGVMGPFRFTIKASGRTIWEAYSWELAAPDTADYQLADGHAYGEDLSRPLTSTLTSESFQSVAAPGGAANANRVYSSIDLTFKTLYSLRFGFQANDNFYTGGLALQTLSSPTLIVENLGSAADWAGYDLDVVLRTCAMVRIDSDTGVITKTLDA